MQCNLLDNYYQQKPEALYTFTPDKSHVYLLNVETNNLLFLRTCNTEFDNKTTKITNQNGRPPEIENKVNLTLLINKQE